MFVHFFWKEKEDRPSSALFYDSKGVSIDRRNHRTEDDLIKDEERLHDLYSKEKLKAIISVEKEFCDSLDVKVKSTPDENNPYHCILYRNEGKNELTNSQRRKLSKNCEIIKRY